MSNYTFEQYLTIRAALREQAKLSEDEISLDTLVGMLGQEIRALRHSGYADVSIADSIRRASGHLFPVEALTQKVGQSRPNTSEPEPGGKPASPERPTGPKTPDEEPYRGKPTENPPAKEPAETPAPGTPRETPLEPVPAEEPTRAPDENPAPTAPADIPTRSVPSEIPSSQPTEIPSSPSVAPAQSNPSISPTIE